MLPDYLIDELFDNHKIKLDRHDLFSLYGGRCIRCNREFNLNTHEIEYRSERPKTWMWWENQVTLCYDCHNYVHRIGGRKGKILLHDLQNRRLMQYYGRSINRDQ